MNKYNFKLILLLINISFACFTRGQVYSQTGWVLQSPYPQSHAIFSSNFLDSNNGYAVGQIGTVIKTTNGGINWTVINLDSLKTFYSCSFININTGFVCGQSGSLYKTVNGGINWNKIITGINNIDFNTVYMVNNSIIYIGSDSGRIIKSIDGGNNWVIQQTPTLGSITQLYLINEQLGFGSVYNGKVIKTTDGGQTWTYIQLTPYYLNSVYFITPLIGYAVGGTFNPLIFKTTDGGNNWFSQFTPSSSQYLNSICFNDTNNGIAVGRGGTIFYTSNGGISWLDATQYSNYQDLFSINIINLSTALCFGDEGTILKSENLGNNWSLIFSGTIYDLNAIFFINENTGYAGGDGFNGYNILKTTNGGQYWYKQRFVNNSTEISSIYFLDSNVGFAAGSVCLFKTTDNGLNWNLYTPLFNGALNDIKFINASTGYIVGGGIYKTTNTGLYWSLIDSSYSFYNLQFVDTQIGYTSGSSGQVLKTTNSGLNWLHLNTGTSSDLNSISFINVNTGYVCGGYNSIILKTENAGSNWINIFNGIGYNLHSIYFVNVNTGYAVGGYSLNSLILKTTNAGLNWFQFNSGVNSQLNHVVFVNDTVGYAVGNWGIIIKTIDGGGLPIGIKKINLEIPNDNQLFPNFPNPFNNSTRIRYKILNTSFVKLIIYDILGRELNNLVSEKQNPRTYETKWEATNYSSGVYFLVLQLEDKIYSRKIVLIK